MFIVFHFVGCHLGLWNDVMNNFFIFLFIGQDIVQDNLDYLYLLELILPRQRLATQPWVSGIKVDKKTAKTATNMAFLSFCDILDMSHFRNF